MNSGNNLSFSQKHLIDKTACVFFISGENEEGVIQYVYVAVRASDIEKFKKAYQEEYFDPNEHGAVLAWGRGKPDEKTIQKMQDEYGFNHKDCIWLEPK